MNQVDKLNALNDLLPQTQCGLCEHAGCKPYARAMLEQGERLDRCLPGGIDTLRALGQFLAQDVTPLEAEMRSKQKPVLTARIREDECIGCTKCIQACPVDAISGAAKLMHTVLHSECTGCELCVEPCPMDCIDMIELAVKTPKTYYDQHRHYWQARHDAHQQRHHQPTPDQQQALVTNQQDYIANALARMQNKQAKGKTT